MNKLAVILMTYALLSGGARVYLRSLVIKANIAPPKETYYEGISYYNVETVEVAIMQEFFRKIYLLPGSGDPLL
jgi:hypothetical protein